jgi:hypothetical protein
MLWNSDDVNMLDVEERGVWTEVSKRVFFRFSARSFLCFFIISTRAQHHGQHLLGDTRSYNPPSNYFRKSTSAPVVSIATQTMAPSLCVASRRRLQNGRMTSSASGCTASCELRVEHVPTLSAVYICFRLDKRQPPLRVQHCLPSASFNSSKCR